MSDKDTERLTQTMLANARESEAEPVLPQETRPAGVEAFFLENFNVDRVFRGIDRADYIFLYYIQMCKEQTPDREEVYLSELSDAMKLDVTEISRAVERLQDKGYVMWKTDASQGRTYVLFTSKSVEMMAAEKARMMKCYQAIVQEIGMGELGETVMTLRKIMDIINRTNADAE